MASRKTRRSTYQRGGGFAATPQPRAESVRVPGSSTRREQVRLPPRTLAPPRTIGLQLARLVSEAPGGDEWLHEVKFDGYRLLLWRNGRQVRISSRGNQDWTGKLPRAAEALRSLPCRSCVLDGELISVDEAGVSHFARLQQNFGEPGGEARMQIMVFDLLWLDGRDLRDEPQLTRKEALARLLKKPPLPLKLTAFTRGRGALTIERACSAGLEGIVCKDSAAPYRAGRPGSWLKVKCVASDEFAIVGYTRGEGARDALGSLLLAVPDGKAWRYVGRVGTGFNDATLRELRRRMRAATERVNLHNAPAGAQLRGASPIWVRPELIAEIEYRGYTRDGLLRQASFKGLRRDRSIASLRPAGRDRAAVHVPVEGGEG